LSQTLIGPHKSATCSWPLTAKINKEVLKIMLVLYCFGTLLSKIEPSFTVFASPQ
jgi:hypothetical protein